MVYNMVCPECETCFFIGSGNSVYIQTVYVSEEDGYLATVMCPKCEYQSPAYGDMHEAIKAFNIGAQDNE